MTGGLCRYWYVACRSAALGGRPRAATVLGTPLALFRDGAGRPAAVADRCPHRNVPLSMGRCRDGDLECRYHGWRFDAAGACRAVPGLCDPEPARRARSVDAYPVIESDGFVWVWPDRESPPDGEPVRFPSVDAPGYDTVRRSFMLTTSLHAALENTLDVPHTAFLHGGWFRGGRPPVEVEVIVRASEGGVEAEYRGEPRPPGLAGRILAPGGGIVTHHDRFRLPSVAQVEYRLEANHVLVTSAFTPAEEGRVALHAAVTFALTVPHRLVAVVLPPVARVILGQDARMLRRQAANVARFGGERYASTELDVLGQHILRLLKRADRGEAADGDLVAERRVTMML